MIDRIRRPGLFLPFAAAVVAVKLFLTAHIAILPIDGPYDEMNYLWHASSLARGAWFGPYNTLTLIKMPFYPMFLAALEILRVPLPLAHQIVYAAATFVACKAIEPIVRGERTLFAMFTFLLFNPYTFDGTAWYAQRSAISGSLALLAVACACALVVRAAAPVRTLAPWCAALTVSFTAFWLTREESVWIVPCMTVLFAAFAFATRGLSAKERAARIALPLLAPSVLALSIAGISAVNASHYGWSTIVENETPEFLSAYDALARIKHGTTDPLVPVPYESLEVAYRASEAARELRTGFTGMAGARGQAISCSFMNVCGDLAGGWFIWVFRSAVATSGHANSGNAARDFFVRISNEIDHACDARAIACNPKEVGLFPNAAFRDAPTLLRTYGVGLAAFFFGEGYSLMPLDAGTPPAANLPLYRLVTGNVATRSPSGSNASMVLELIALVYRYTTPLLSLATALSIIFRIRELARTHGATAIGADAVIASAVFAGILALVGILAVVQTYQFTAFFPEYFNPGYALLYFAIGLTLATEVTRFRERDVARARPSASRSR